MLRGPARGTRFVVEPGIGASYALATDGAASHSFRTRVRPGMTVYDIGANKGQMALLFASLVGPNGTIVALEPAPREHDSLVRNLALNDLGMVRTIHAAAFHETGEIEFEYAPQRPMQGKVADVEPTYGKRAATKLSVPAVRLDDLVAEHGQPDFIKIDVEGAAAAVLKGARRILEETAPLLYVELHGPEEQAGIRDEVLARGYVAERLDGTPVPDPTDGWHSPLWCYRPT
ncbi:MAG: FkbM family methyltransferase [Rhodothermales bacterium]